MANFQVKLGGEWQDYDRTADTCLKAAFQSGFAYATLERRGQSYTVDFRRMVQKNMSTKTERQIRPPRRGKAPPSRPVMDAGLKTMVTVPPGAPGCVIAVPDPRRKGKFIPVRVPRSAKPGQSMLVPLPPETARGRSSSRASAKREGSSVGRKSAGGASARRDTSVSRPKTRDSSTSTAPAAEKVADSWTTGTKAATDVGAAVDGVLLGADMAELVEDSGDCTDTTEDRGGLVVDLF